MEVTEISFKPGIWSGAKVTPCIDECCGTRSSPSIHHHSSYFELTDSEGNCYQTSSSLAQVAAIEKVGMLDSFWYWVSLKHWQQIVNTQKLSWGGILNFFSAHSSDYIHSSSGNRGFWCSNVIVLPFHHRTLLSGWEIASGKERIARFSDTRYWEVWSPCNVLLNIWNTMESPPPQSPSGVYRPNQS